MKLRSILYTFENMLDVLEDWSNLLDDFVYGMIDGIGNFVGGLLCSIADAPGAIIRRMGW